LVSRAVERAKAFSGQISKLAQIETKPWLEFRREGKRITAPKIAYALGRWDGCGLFFLDITKHGGIMNTNSDPGVGIVDCDGRHDETYPSAIYDCLDMADKYGWPPKFYFRDGSLNEELARTGVWNTDDAQSVKDDDARALAEALDRAIAAEPNFELVDVLRSLGEIARALDEALDRADAAEPNVERVDVLRWLGEIARALVEAYDAANFERVDLPRRLAEIARRGGFTVYWNQHEVGHRWRRSRSV
jgi:hypothetical protein